MIVPMLILVFSTALFCLYCQFAVQKILRRAFSQAYFQAIVHSNRLEFPALRKAFEELEAPVDYAHLWLNMQCDFQALVYLLKNASNLRQSFSLEERFLMLYFRLVLASLAVRHWLRMREKPAVMALASILQYFANVVGARVNALRTGDFSNPDLAMNL